MTVSESMKAVDPSGRLMSASRQTFAVIVSGLRKSPAGVEENKIEIVSIVRTEQPAIF